jgi:hypothetical protein
MMMLNSTNWRNVWLIHDTRVTASPDRMADGSETKASAAKAYAHHMVPTPLVILTASAALKRVYQGVRRGRDDIGDLGRPDLVELRYACVGDVFEDVGHAASLARRCPRPGYDQPHR